MKRLLAPVIYFVEKADIVPLLVIVSAVHYAGALWAKDPPVIAIILGVLIDLGHYRMVKSYLSKMEKKRLTVLILWTVLTTYYHWRWYQDPLLSATVPLLIIFLALLSRWERWSAQAPAVRVEKSAEASALPARSSGASALPVPLECPECHATANAKGDPFLSQQALAGHQRSHTRKVA